MAGGFLIVLLILLVLGGFFGAGYAIALRWRRGKPLTALYGALIGLGLMCLCVAVLFGACLCAIYKQ